MKKQAKPAASKAAYSVPKIYQQLFIYSVIASYVIMLAFTMYGTFSYNAPFAIIRSQLVYEGINSGTPLLLFVLAYLLNPRKINKQAKIFEALLPAVSIYLLWGAVQFFLNLVLVRVLGPENSDTVYLSVYGAFLVLYALAIYSIRKKYFKG